MLAVMRAVVAAMLLLAACKEDRAELDRAEREDRRRPLGSRTDAWALPSPTAPAPLPVETPTPLGFGPAAQMFVDLMAKAMPGEFCGEPMYFRQCFTITETECRTRVAAAFTGCVRRLAAEIPEHLDAVTGRLAGQKLGSCTGTQYEIALAAEGRRSSRAECDDIDRWR